MPLVYLALGSNLGEREKNLSAAIDLLKTNLDIEVLAQSSWIDNPAIEDAGPNDFLNGVIKINTKLSPRELLLVTQRIEKKIDPERQLRGSKKARYLDIDILLYGEERIKEPDLTIPHPKMRERFFVMKALKELEAQEAAQEIVEKIDNDLNLNSFNNLSINSKLNIRRMYLTDLDQVLEINQEAFGSRHWSRNVFLQELANENSLYLVVETESSSITGFAGVTFVLDEMHILTIATHKDCRRQKIAESLLNALIQTAQKNSSRIITLEVNRDNFAAIQLYKKLGFQYIGIRKEYYEDGTDAEIYTLEL